MPSILLPVLLLAVALVGASMLGHRDARLRSQVVGPKEVETEPMGLSDWQISLLEGKISQALESGARDQIPGIAENCSWLKGQLDAGKVGLAITPLAHGNVVAFTQAGSLPMIHFAGPVVWERKLRLPEADFQDMAIEALCHEALHLRLTPGAPGKPGSNSAYRKYVMGEAKVWAKQVKTITRPMMSQNRSVDMLAVNAESAFADAGDQNNDQWQRWVCSNLCIKQ